MKKTVFIFFSSSFLLLSCQKSISDFDPSTGSNIPTGGTASGGFEATVNGQQLSFNITAAILIRTITLNEKRMDITGTTADGTKRLVVTLGEETAAGNGVTVKKYTLNPFPEDNPATPDIDESFGTEGFSTYGTFSNNTWMYGVYDETGSFTVTSCDAAARLVSGSFETVITDLTDGTVYKITAGRITKVKYIVLN